MIQPKPFPASIPPDLIDWLESVAPPVQITDPTQLSDERRRYQLAFDAGARSVVDRINQERTRPR